MTETRIKISSIVNNQLPQFVKEEFPLVSEFLSQYYISLESQGSVSDILQNIDQYVKVDSLTNLIESTTLTSDVTFFDSTINVTSTAGFPESYGLILIDSEIITYTSKTATSFNGCVRGFSGITSYDLNDNLVFTQTNSEEHKSVVNDVETQVTNLSILFLKEFFKKVKRQITPGFEDRELYSDLDERLFIKQSIDFYSSKGTDGSFKILFKALYGKDVDVIKPRDHLIEPSSADYRITKDLVVKPLEGDLSLLSNRTIYQDETDFIKKTSGTVTKVEKIIRGENEYYVLSLDYGYSRDVDGTVLGEFSIHPKTKIITSIKDSDPSVSGFTTSFSSIDVDSTVGFPKSGELIVDLPNGEQLVISYNGKTLNQFLNCSGINQPIDSGTDIRLNVFAYGETDSGLIKFTITGVLSNLILDKTKYQDIDFPISIKSLGNELQTIRSNNWFFNNAVRSDVKSIVSSGTQKYKVIFYDQHSFIVGDSVTLKSSSGEFIEANVINFDSLESIFIISDQELDTNKKYIAYRNLSRVNSSNYPELSVYTSNVQNVYSDYSEEDSLYITSPSLPTYFDQPLTIKDKSVTINGSFNGVEIEIGSHSFYTGDRVYYRHGSNNLGIQSGYYFVKKINDNKISLSRSRADISSGKFVSVSGDVTDNKLELADFVDEVTLQLKKIEPQKIIRNLKPPTNSSLKSDTKFGTTGILVNGVEILNYKSQDYISYGPIEKIDVLSPGSNYDIINPPVLEISDSVGSGATAYCSVTGGLSRIDILDSGFDYLEEPKIVISGGNGSQASAKVNLVSFDHEVSFNSNSSSNVSIAQSTITFSEYHKFRDAETVIYDTQGQTSVGGLSTNSQYIVSVQNASTIKLFNNIRDYTSGINTVPITSLGSGVHKFKSTIKKRKIGSISIENSGTLYSNKKTTAKTTDINIYSDVISIKNHGYKTGEILKYSHTGTPISGLSTSSSYYAKVIDDNNFKLSIVGSGTTDKEFFLRTNQYVDLQSVGSGLHIFNYEPITVNVIGRIGISTLSGRDFGASVQPIFRGQIDSVFVQDGGFSYGSEDILNYSRQPEFILKSGSGAILTPIINGGKIVDVVINSSGNYYNSPPDLIINGSGVGAILAPVISNGTIASVKIISGGGGYINGQTSIDVIPSGSSCKLNAQIKTWNVNLVERFINSEEITDDDGIPTVGRNKFGLQYSHLYSPRNLRKSIFGSRFRNGELIYEPDLVIESNKEVESKSHSPIIGWAYDGNPIYGPYGYSEITGGIIKSMVSGYELISQTERVNGPSKSIYPIGFFVEDYVYTGNGDLDECNGRFCITPEYPNGVYAYFTTINNGSVDSSGKFENYKKPVFPYFIGNTYKSEPLPFNFLKTSNQDDIDINEQKWLRNTTPYKLNKEYSGYDYIFDPNKVRNQKSIVKSISSGEISSVGIITGGDNYKVGDKIVFEPATLDNVSPSALVSTIKGRTVTSVSAATSSISGVEIYKLANTSRYVAISSSPHGFNNFDNVTFSSIFEYKNTSSVGISSNTLSLTTGIGSANYTGIVTFFNVNGPLSSIRENDIYYIGNEKIKVLNVDRTSSRIRVIRNQYNTVGIVSYSAGQILYEIPRKLSLKISNIQGSYDLTKQNIEYYFDPTESVGLGTTSGVGINSTINFSNPGVGITQLSIPTRSIYLPNHSLSNGDELIYSSNGGTRVSVSTNGVSSFQLEEKSIVYSTVLSKDLIGISTIKVGLGTQGNYVGIGSTSGSLLYITNVGSGNTHSFKTNYTNILVGDVFKTNVTVSTASSHGLSLYDNIFLDVKSGISTTAKLIYNDANARSCINPKSFTSADVDIAKNAIKIQNHEFTFGQKVIHTSTSPSGGLVNERIYYVIVVDKDTVKLSESYYPTALKEQNIVNITSESNGTLSSINPPINLTENNTLVFDLSDSSLRFTSRSINYSAFELNFYTDPLFKNKFDFSQSNVFEITRNGSVGIDADANVTLRRTSTTPDTLYYKLEPINSSILPNNKKSIIVDDSVEGNNQISLVPSKYKNTHQLIGISSNTFNFTLSELPELLNYNSDNSTIFYTTNSRSASGSIYNIDVNSRGKNLKSLPRVLSVDSENGSGHILESESDNIASIRKTIISDIGFDYSSDFSIRPKVKTVDVLKISPQSSFKSIGISSSGINYATAPNLIVLDGLTNDIISDVDLQYDLENRKVNILKNTKGINNIIPKILPINNTNGIDISNITFNFATKNVVVTLGPNFSDPDDFPFEVGGKVFIENVSVGVGSTGKGFNSKNYNYELFTLTGVSTSLGGSGATVTYNLGNYLSSGEIPGIFDIINPSGTIVPEKYFPTFDILLEKNSFFVGEKTTSSSANGVVVDWDKDSEYLKVSTSSDHKVGDIITGESSKSTATILSILDGSGYYDVSAGSIVENGWEKETGFINNQFQRIHDSDYYQYFSYSLKSEIPIETWIDPVSSLNHTAGFKKFSDLVITSDTSSAGISTEQNDGDFSSTVDISEVIDLNCTYDFDLVTENNLNIDQSIKSDQIIFNSRLLQDYIESNGNRVLYLDNIGDQFTDQSRPTQYSIIDTFRFDSDLRSSKYIVLVRDKTYTSERQVNLITFIHDGYYGYLNQYGFVDTKYDMGSFDFINIGEEANLIFYPTKSTVNNFDISTISFDINDGITSVGSTNLGEVVFVGSSTTSIVSGTSSPVNVVGIASTYRSSKILVQIGSTTSDYFEFDELNLIHNDTEIYLQDYGQLTTSEFQSYSSSGIGTYYAYYSGSNIKVDLIPYETTDVQYDINSVRISIGNSSTSGVGTETFDFSSISSGYKNISSSPTPGINTISSYSSEYQGAYYIVSVEDLTNNQYEISEIVVVNDSSEVYFSQFGVIQTNDSIGSIGATISSGNVDLTFTPNVNTEVQVRVYQNSIGVCTLTNSEESLNFNNSIIRTNCAEYEGSEFAVKRSFELTHKNLPIFERYFDGSSSSIIDFVQDTIEIPDHFFVSGERLTYNFGSGEPIGIATTTITGIGLTDKLPSTVYAVKYTDRNDRDFKIRVSATAEDSLAVPPKVLDLVSVGIGTSHRFTSSYQNNTKLLITLDNIIQSPIVSTSVTTTTSNIVNLTDERIYFYDTTNFSSGDVIKIDDEIMKIKSIGVGSSNTVIVNRSWLGTGISTHSTSSIVTKVIGDYNIVNNTINFESAPQGPSPIGSITNPPDSRDFTDIQTSYRFGGRVFIRSGIPGESNEAYYDNYLLDDISPSFNGITSSFNLTSDQSNIVDIFDNNAIILINDILQVPENENYQLSESGGVTDIEFTGVGVSATYDVNTASIPRGGIIVSVSSTEGFAYQPLISAGGTAIVSAAGTIQSISIGNSGSGYRVGIQTIVNVGVATSSTGTPNIEFIGTAVVSGGRIVSVKITNPGSGYTSSNPPIVVFDDPLSYSNLPLIYSSSSTAGVGTGSKVNLVVSEDSKVLSFELINSGFGYKKGEILTVGIGGTSGIPTSTNFGPFKEFQITVDETFVDKFSGWIVGDLQLIDSIEPLFDGVKKVFPIKINGNQTTIRSKIGSPVEVKYNLLVFVNNILQNPDESYIFNGGSRITFTEAPKQGDFCTILFYKGTSSVDTLEVDVLESVKIGDTLTINSDEQFLKEDSRLTLEIISTDIVRTNIYPGPGVSSEDEVRPVTFCRQSSDKIINGQEVSKDRILYEPIIQPTTNIIQNVGTSSTQIFVENVKTFFDSNKEYEKDGITELPQRKIIIISQDDLRSASASVVVSSSGTISSISITDGGVGYTTTPSVTIENPVGLGITQRATFSSTISVGGTVSSISIVNPGSGYTSTNPPTVFIGPPTVNREIIDRVTYSGDFGIVSGIQTVSVGVASTGIVFDLFIPTNSYLRDLNINPVGLGSTVSGIKTGYYFVIRNSNIGYGLTSLNQSGSVIGIGSTFIDNIYQAVSVSIAQTNVIGVGLTYVARVTVSVNGYNGLSGIGYSSFYGEYSWGLISNLVRSNPKSFNYYNKGTVGIDTSPIIQRYNPLRYQNYTS